MVSGGAVDCDHDCGICDGLRSEERVYDCGRGEGQLRMAERVVKGRCGGEKGHEEMFLQEDVEIAQST